MAEGLFQVRLGALVPAEYDAAAVSLMKALNRGATVKVKVWTPRNLGHHKLFFAMLKIVCDNQEHFKNVDELLFALKIKLGLVDYVQTKGGAYPMPQSISFASMDQAAFGKFFDDTVEFLVTEAIPGMDKEELLNEVRLMTGGPQ